MFSGPNGSGKTTIMRDVFSRFDLGIYLNTDEIERKFNELGFFEMNKYIIDAITLKNKFDYFIRTHSLTAKALADGFAITIYYNSTKIYSKRDKIHSYEASIISDFIRNELLILGNKLSFETVMSHSSKLDILKKVKDLGYKTYLYFICTESSLINISRVKSRVAKGGHLVAYDKIVKRYYRSLALLKDAVLNSDRAYIFDNSGKQSFLVLDVENGETVTYHCDTIPIWVDTYLLRKKVDDDNDFDNDNNRM